MVDRNELFSDPRGIGKKREKIPSYILNSLNEDIGMKQRRIYKESRFVDSKGNALEVGDRVRVNQAGHKFSGKVTDDTGDQLEVSGTLVDSQYATLVKKAKKEGTKMKRYTRLFNEAKEISQMSDDELMDYYETLTSSKRNPDNRDQDEKDIKAVKVELQKRGFRG